METKLERIADKARKDSNLKITSIAHYITKELIYESLYHIPSKTATDVYAIDVDEAKENFELWVNEMINSIHRKGYHPPAVKKFGYLRQGMLKSAQLVFHAADRALQRSVSTVL